MAATINRPGSRTLLLVSALGIGALGCASSPGTAPESAVRPSHVSSDTTKEKETETETNGDKGRAEAMAPPPATAEQIREAWVVGLLVELRTQGQGVAQIERIRVVDADERAVEMEFSAPGEAPEGDAPEPQRRRFTWEELAAHGLFPAAQTTRERGRRETPLGPLEGWTYAISGTSGEVTRELFFADAMPGMPVLSRTQEGDGQIVETAQVLRCVAGVDDPCP